jgi:hypothetical protein
MFLIRNITNINAYEKIPGDIGSEKPPKFFIFEHKF